MPGVRVFGKQRVSYRKLFTWHHPLGTSLRYQTRNLLLWGLGIGAYVLHGAGMFVAVEANSYLWHPAFPPERHRLHYGPYRQVKLPGKVNINTAAYDDLMALPGVNAHIAVAIIRHRPYKSLHDLAQLHPTVPLTEVKQLQRKLSPAVDFGNGQVPRVHFTIPKDVTFPSSPPVFRLAI
jgi:hypothetical protein